MEASWNDAKAEETAGHLIQQLMNVGCNLKFESASAYREDGIIYFTNSAGTRVKVFISREALTDYIDGNASAKYAMEGRLAKQFEQIDASGEKEALVKSEHLSP